MAFVDEITITAEAGRGGDGVVRWLHEKGQGILWGGWAAMAEKGGDVYVRAIRDIQKLAQYSHERIFEAGKGEAGMKNSRHGADGEDMIYRSCLSALLLPILLQAKSIQLLNEGDEVLLLKGGRGGLGQRAL
jgi:GTP-binding protein